VPSGASTGAHEAHELRDGDKTATSARAFSRPSMPSTARSSTRSAGMDATETAALDAAMIELDGTDNKARLGANAILGVSWPRQGGGGYTAMPLYRYVGGVAPRILPCR
jgi:enolase